MGHAGTVYTGLMGLNIVPIKYSSLKVYVFLFLSNYVKYKAIIISIILNVKYILNYHGKQIVY